MKHPQSGSEPKDSPSLDFLLCVDLEIYRAVDDYSGGYCTSRFCGNRGNCDWFVLRGGSQDDGSDLDRCRLGQGSLENQRVLQLHSRQNGGVRHEADDDRNL